MLAIHITVVNPPLAAAAAPVSISSLYSNPGSRKCTCESTRPGATTRPVASITATSLFSSQVPSPVSISFSTWIILPSSIRTSLTSSVPVIGQTTLPFFISIIYFSLSFNYVKKKVTGARACDHSTSFEYTMQCMWCFPRCHVYASSTDVNSMQVFPRCLSNLVFHHFKFNS